MKYYVIKIEESPPFVANGISGLHKINWTQNDRYCVFFCIWNYNLYGEVQTQAFLKPQDQIKDESLSYMILLFDFLFQLIHLIKLVGITESTPGIQPKLNWFIVDRYSRNAEAEAKTWRMNIRKISREPPGHRAAQAAGDKVPINTTQ